MADDPWAVVDTKPVDATTSPGDPWAVVDTKPVSPAQPDTPRWDWAGDTNRAATSAYGALKSDVAKAFPSTESRVQQTEQNRKSYGMIGGAAADMVDKTKAIGNLASIPMDALAIVGSPFTGLLHSTAGSALSYLPGMDKRSADEAIDESLIGLGPEGSKIGGGTPFSLDRLVREAKPDVDAARVAKGEQRAADKAEKLTDKATAMINKRAKDDRLSPEEVQRQQAAAQASGDPMTLLDFGGRKLRGLGGAVIRAQGEGSNIIEDLLKTRNEQAGPALKAEVDKIAKGSTYEAVNQLYGQRSAAAKPLYAKAFETGSTAPFEHSYQQALKTVTDAEKRAKATLATAQKAEMKAMQDLYGGGGLHAGPTDASMATARDAVSEAQKQLKALSELKTKLAELYEKAKADRTANAPGAVWSPRLHQLMADPDVQAGIQRGLRIEKKNALAEGRPFDDSDYAIVGKDKKGNPIIGTVPTMKMLAAAKEGLDAIVLDQVHPIGHTSAGRPTKEGMANRALRDELKKELVRLNPTYGQAIEAWAGPSESIDAMNMGRDHFSRKDSDEMVKAEYDALSPANKQFYNLGAAESQIDKIQRTRDVADKSKSLINSDKDRARFRMLFKSDEEAQAFLDSVARKRTMFETKSALISGSPSAERLGEDSALNPETAMRGLHAVGKLASQNYLGAIMDGIRLRRELGWTSDEALHAEVARILADPNFTTDPTGKGLITSPARSVVQQLGLPPASP